MRVTPVIFLLVSLALSIAPGTLAQNTDPNNDTGIHAYEGYDGARESINLGSGNVLVSVPLLTLPGRNGFNYSARMIFNSQSWSPASGWVNKSVGMTVTRPGNIYFHPSGIVDPVSGVQCNSGYQMTDENGGGHTFSGVQSNCIWVGGGPNQGMREPQYDVLGGNDDRGEGINVDISRCTLTLKNGNWFPLHSGSGGCPLIGVIGGGGAYPPTMEDSNGNQIFFGAVNGTSASYSLVGGGDLFPSGTDIDTLGRSIAFSNHTIQYHDSNGVQRTITLYVQSLTLSCTFAVPGGGLSQPSGTANVITSAVLPNGLTYIFQYDGCGNLSKIVYPSGGYTRYVYDYSHYTHAVYANGSGQATTATDIELVQKYVCRAAAVAPGATSTGTGNTCPVAEDMTAFSPTTSGCFNSAMSVTDPLGNSIAYQFGGSGYQCGYSAVETSRQIYQGSSTLLRTVQTQYSGIAGDFPAIQTTILPNGLQSQTQWDYWCNCSDDLKEKREYGWGQGAHGALARKTDYGQNYCNAKAPSETVYDGSGNQIALTTYEFDSYTSGISSSGAVQHDSNYGAGFTARCNVTAIQRWRNTDGATLTTRMQYDDAGNALSATDPLNHTTTTSYTDVWGNNGCAPAGNTAAYPTQVTDPAGLITKHSYNSCTGTVATSTDPNLQVTNLTYDLMDRLSQSNLPDGGQASSCFSEVSGGNCYSSSYPLKVVSTQKITSSLSKVSTAVLDGLARVTQTQLNSDPDGVTYVDTTYDSIERKSTVSNPYRSTSDATYGVTTYQYDALGRVLKVIPPDGTSSSNNVFTSYDIATGTTNCTTATDQASESRKSCADALGRLVGMFEDPAGFNYETDYTYDSLNNLLTVNQKGGTTDSTKWRTRTFTYDSLSHLLTANNPESGVVTYAYDSDGNLLSKTSPAPNQDGFPGTGSGTVSGSEQSKPGPPATSGTGSVTFSGTLQSKQVLSQAATAGTGSVTLNGSLQSIAAVPATSGTGSVTIYGSERDNTFDPCQPHSSCPQQIPDTGYVSITVNGFTASYTYGYPDTSSTVAAGLASALNGGSSPVTASASGGVVTLTAKATGSSTNYSLSSSCNTTQTSWYSGCSFSGSASGSTLTGGANSKPAVYDSGTCTITANSHGDSTSWSGSGTTSSSIASALVSSINGDGGASITSGLSGSTVNLTAKTTGAATNYSLSSSCSYDTSHFSSPSFSTSNSGSALTGGRDATYTTIYDSGSSTITVNGHADSVSWSGSGTTTSSISSGLASAINADSAASVSASASGGTVNLTAKTTGAGTNYSLSSSSTYDSADFSSASFSSSNSGSALTGGQNAGATIYDSGSVWITINGTQYSVGYIQSSTTSSLGSSLASAISAGSLANASANGSGISITAKTDGSITNYSLSSGSSTSQPGSFSSPSFSVSISGSSLTGGKDPGGSTITTSYSYDAGNRLTQRSFSDGVTPTVKYGYDGVALSGCTVAPPALTDSYPKGHRTAMCDGAGAESWSHDNMGRALTDLRTTNSVTKPTAYTYNFNGSVATLTYPSNRVITYTPKSSGTNTAGRMLSAVDSTGPINYATAASYAPQGALTSITNGASVISTLYFNNRLQPCRISAKNSGNAPSSCADTTVANVLDFTYNFSLGSADNGNVMGITNNRDNTRSQNFTYDALNRLATAQTQTTGVTIPNSNCWGLTFDYDAWGNLASSTVSGPSGCSEPLGFSLYPTPTNQLSTSSTQLTGYCYDAAGNLALNSTCPTGSFTPAYSYNAENQLTSAAGVNYSYDGDGKRVMKSNGTIYWYGMNGDALDETDSAGNTNNSSFFEYVFFGGKRIARRDYQNNVNYYFADHLGTSRVVTNSSGTILDDSDFYPFGGERVILSSSGNRYKFTSKERDSESGLDDFGARYYSSSLGRFASADPLLSSGRLPNPQTWNRYAYALNNPLRTVDPAGLFDWDYMAGGALGDDELCLLIKGKSPRKLRHWAQRALEFRQRFRTALKAADDAAGSDELTDKQSEAVQAAVDAYGTENDANGVFVGFEGDYGATTQLLNDDYIAVRFGSFLSGDFLAATVAHEGEHVVQDKAWVDGGESAVNNLTHTAREEGAWPIGSYVAQALGMKSYAPHNGGQELQVWSKGWRAAEIETLRSKGVRNILNYMKEHSSEADMQKTFTDEHSHRDN